MTRPALFAALLTGLLAASSRADVEVAPPPRPKGVPFTPPAKAEDPAETVGKIIQNAKDVTERLSKSDTSTTTRKTQDETLALIDKLINRQDDPPPSGDDSKDKKDNKDKSDDKDKKDDQPKDGKDGMGQPKDGMGQKDGMGGKEQGKGRRPRSEQGKEQAGKQPNGAGEKQGEPKEPGGKEPTGGTAGTTPGNSTSGPPQKVALPADDDVAKDVWGHLPDKLRQQVTAYYKEEFMPRYADLLKQYYSSLSEKAAKPGEKK